MYVLLTKLNLKDKNLSLSLNVDIFIVIKAFPTLKCWICPSPSVWYKMHRKADPRSLHFICPVHVCVARPSDRFSGWRCRVVAVDGWRKPWSIQVINSHQKHMHGPRETHSPCLFVLSILVYSCYAGGGGRGRMNVQQMFGWNISINLWAVEESSCSGVTFVVVIAVW